MKTTLKLLALISILTITSCGVKDVVMKRKYNKGYYVDINNNKQKANKNNIVEQPASASPITSVSEEQKLTFEIAQQEQNQVTDADLTATADKTHPYIKTKAPVDFSTKKNQKTNTIKTDSKNNTVVVKENFKTKILKRIVGKKIQSTANNKTTSANTLLLVILSLFPILALIAIYIKDGNRITTNFWVDLLLHFIFLYWLFALLVVLDVINLA
ncbi:MAG: hypothetical protein ABI315_03095 [Bacteroidia bacterium]